MMLPTWWTTTTLFFCQKNLLIIAEFNRWFPTISVGKLYFYWILKDKVCFKCMVSWQIHTSFLPSKRNLYLKLQFWPKKYGEKWSRKNIFLNSSMRKPFFSNSLYLVVFRKITNSVTKITIFPHGGKSKICFLPYEQDLIHLLEQKLCPDSNLRVKMMYESVE